MNPASNKPSDIVTYRLDKLDEKQKERDEIMTTALERIDEKLDGVCQSVSNLDTGRGVNATNITNLCSRLDGLEDHLKVVEGRTYTLSGANALFAAVASIVATVFGPK